MFRNMVASYLGHVVMVLIMLVICGLVSWYLVLFVEFDYWSPNDFSFTIYTV